MSVVLANLQYIASEFLLVLFVTILTTSAGWRTETYCPVKHPTGSSVYFKDTPAQVFSGTELKTACAMQCSFAESIDCTSFAYNASSLDCNLYSAAPTSFGLATDTTAYQVSHLTDPENLRS